tara:strand:- start:2779 stop:3666 length:888 start_codon:yes stop_codon:yes gene_type:complete
MFEFREQRIEFLVNNSKVVGNLFVPENDKISEFPAMFIAGPMTSVKEQVTGVYAKALAEKGFVTLVIDHRYFGESGGEPRQYEKFTDKIIDIKKAFEFLKNRPEVNQRYVSIVGVCLGAGYALATASEIMGVYKLAAVAGYYRDTDEMRSKNSEDFDQKVSSGVKAREYYEKTGRILNIPAASLTEEAAMQTQDTVEYYTKRAAVQNYANLYAVMSREFFTKFDVQNYAKKVIRPFLMIHSRNALSPHWADRFYKNVKTSKNRYLIESNGQTDFYDNRVIIDTCVGYISRHLKQS